MAKTAKTRKPKWFESYGLEYRDHYIVVSRDYVDIFIRDWKGRYARGDYDIVVKSFDPSLTAAESEAQAKAWVDAKLDVAA